MRPMTSQYYVHLYDPLVSTIVHTLPLPQYELVTSLEVMSLEISEITHKHKLMVAVGAITDRAENFAARGALYVLDIIDVVPEPGHPETGKMLKIHSREDTKGGITALMGIAGLVGTAQGMFDLWYLPFWSRKRLLTFIIFAGQKMMFRGLREDGSCLPVAFLDAQCYTASLKTLASSKLWLAADAWKGVWFGGFGVRLPLLNPSSFLLLTSLHRRNRTRSRCSASHDPIWKLWRQTSCLQKGSCTL